MTSWRPLGVVGLITPWNFPQSAFPCGKSHRPSPPETPWSSNRLPKHRPPPTSSVNCALKQAFHLESSTSSTAMRDAKAIIEHPDDAAISFTGSTEVGLAIEARCGALHKPIQCEMGGKNPIIVLDDADVTAAAAAAAKGGFGSTGQRCTATSRAIVMNSVADGSAGLVAEHASSIRAGHPLDPSTTMGPSVSERQLAQVLKYMDIARGEAEVAFGGARMTDGNLARGYFPAPTLLDHVSATARVATEEIFGPVLSLIRVDSVEEAIAAANGVRYGLTGSVYTANLSRAFEVIQHLESGITHVNNPTIGGEAHLPFGGIKHTGTGPREMGPDAWEILCRRKSHLHQPCRWCAQRQISLLNGAHSHLFIDLDGVPIGRPHPESKQLHLAFHAEDFFALLLEAFSSAFGSVL